MSKILEKVVAEQLTLYIEDHEIFDKFQSGFHSRYSTETALLRVANDIILAADSGEYTVLVSLDLSSAFDTVDHNILINTLHNIVGISGSVLQCTVYKKIIGQNITVYFTDLFCIFEIPFNLQK